MESETDATKKSSTDSAAPEEQAASSATVRDRECSSTSTYEQTNKSSTNTNNIGKHRHSRALRILELHGRGHTQEEIAEMLDISQATVSKELNRIIASIYDKPDAYALQAYSDQEKSVAGLKAVGRQLWPIAKNDQLSPELRIKALSLLAQTYSKTMQGTKNRRDVRQWLREARSEQNAKEQGKIFGRDLDLDVQHAKEEDVEPHAIPELHKWLEDD